MKFTKMQGIGNDYVYVNCFEENIENPPELSIAISDRHFGVGFTDRQELEKDRQKMAGGVFDNNGAGGVFFWGVTFTDAGVL